MRRLFLALSPLNSEDHLISQNPSVVSFESQASKKGAAYPSASSILIRSAPAGLVRSVTGKRPRSMPALTSLSSTDSDESQAHEPSMEEILASIRRIISDDQSLAAHRDPVHAEMDPEPVREVKSAPVSPPQPAAANAQQERSYSQERPYLNAGIQESSKMAAMEELKAFSSPSFQASPQIAPIERKHADFADMRLRRQIIDDSDRISAPLTRPFADPAPRQHSVEQHSAEPAPLPPLEQATRQSAFQEERPAALRQEEPIVSAATDAAVASSFNALFASRLLPDPQMLAEVTRDLLRPMLKAWLDDNLPVMVERMVRAEIERVARGGR